MYLKFFYVCQLASLIVVQLFLFFWGKKALSCVGGLRFSYVLVSGPWENMYNPHLQIVMLVSVKILVSLSLERKFEIKQIQLVTCI